jgi:cell division protein FtsW
MVLITAQILSAMQRESGADRKAFKYIMFILLPTTFLIGIENLSTAALLFAVVVLMMFIGRVPMSQMGKLVGSIAVLGIVGLVLIMTLGSMEDQPTDATMTETVSNNADRG